MREERLRPDAGERGFLQGHVTSRATVDDTQIRQPDLLHASLKSPRQRHAVAAIANQALVFVLIVQPFAKVILRRHDREHGQQNYA